jgi:DNA gyrase/topoisomerase IV subunit B
VFVNLAFQLILENTNLLRYPRCVVDHFPYCVDFKNTNEVEYRNYFYRWRNGFAQEYSITQNTNAKGHGHEVQFWPLEHLMPYAIEFSTSLMNGQL